MCFSTDGPVPVPEAHRPGLVVAVCNKLHVGIDGVHSSSKSQVVGVVEGLPTVLQLACMSPCLFNLFHSQQN